MDATNDKPRKPLGQFRRPRRFSSAAWLSAAILAFVITARLGYTPKNINPDTFRSGNYQVERVNTDGSLRLVIPGASLSEIDVHWLGIEMTDCPAATAWVQSELRSGNSVRVRWDRRRLDASGNLIAYFFLGDRLLNADLIRRGFAREATHPTDFAPIARQLRQAVAAEDFHR